MLNYQKNKLLNSLLRFEQDFNETKNDIDNETNRLHRQGHFLKASAHSFIVDIIYRNLTSIKKQIKKL